MNKKFIANEILKVIMKDIVLKKDIKQILLNLIISNIHDNTNNICLRNKHVSLENLDKYKLYDEDLIDIKQLIIELLTNCKYNNKDLLLVEKFIKEFYVNCKVCDNKYPITIMSKSHKILCPECQNLSIKLNENSNFINNENLESFLKNSKILLPNFNIYQLREIYRKLYYN